MASYKEKPRVVEAIQFSETADNIREILDLSPSITLLAPDLLALQTLEGRKKARIGDWITKEVGGEVDTYKADIFAKLYAKKLL